MSLGIYPSTLTDWNEELQLPKNWIGNDWITWIKHYINQSKQRTEGRYVGIKLPHEAREIAVLEVLGQEMPSEVRRVPHHEAVIPGSPRNDRVGRQIIHHVVRLAEERRRRTPVHPGDRTRRRRHRFSISPAFLHRSSALLDAI